MEINKEFMKLAAENPELPTEQINKILDVFGVN